MCFGILNQCKLLVRKTFIFTEQEIVHQAKVLFWLATFAVQQKLRVKTMRFLQNALSWLGLNVQLSFY